MNWELLNSISFITMAAMSAGLYMFLLGCGTPLPPKKMRGKIWLFFIAVPVLISAGSSAFLQTHQTSPAEFFATQLRKNFSPPMPLNEHMRLENIVAEDNRVVFLVSISPYVDKPRQHMDDLQKELAADACSQEDFLAGMQNNLSLEIRFTQEGSEARSIIVSPADCRRGP